MNRYASLLIAFFTLTANQLGFGAQASLPRQAIINVPVEHLSLDATEPFTHDTFKNLIAEQRAHGDPYILARVNILPDISYFDGHSLTKYLLGILRKTEWNSVLQGAGMRYVLDQNYPVQKIHVIDGRNQEVINPLGRQLIRHNRDIQYYEFGDNDQFNYLFSNADIFTEPDYTKRSKNLDRLYANHFPNNPSYAYNKPNEQQQQTVTQLENLRVQARARLQAEPYVAPEQVQPAVQQPAQVAAQRAVQQLAVQPIAPRPAQPVAQRAVQDPNQQLLDAAFAGNLEDLRQARRNGATIEIRINGLTALHWAVTGDHLDVVQALIEEYRANPNAENNLGYTALDMAERLNHEAIARYLRQRGGQTGAQVRAAVQAAAQQPAQPAAQVAAEQEQMTPDQQLLHAAENGDLNSVTAALARGANRNAQDNNGQTALHWAVTMGNANIVRALIGEYRANPNLQNNLGLTALDIAINLDFMHIAEYLQVHGGQRGPGQQAARQIVPWRP